MELKPVLEAILFSAQKPLSPKEIRDVLAGAVEHAEGDEQAKALDYVPLPDPLVRQIEAYWTANWTSMMFSSPVSIRYSSRIPLNLAVCTFASCAERGAPNKSSTAACSLSSLLHMLVMCPIPCTKCEYCMPCPNGVNIPRNFEIFNQGKMYAKPDSARNDYKFWLPKEEWASECIDCGTCEPLCPQTIPISDWMPIVHSVLGEGKAYEECQHP